MKSFLRSLGPGLLFAGAAIGVSHLVQSTRAGADFGFGLLWVIVVAHFFKYPFFQYGPRYSLATGESLLEGYLKLGKPLLWAYFLLSLATMFTIQTAVTLVTAGIAIRLFHTADQPVLWSAMITFISAALLFWGRYRLLDRMMKIIVLALSLSTVLAAMLAFRNTEALPEFEPLFPHSAGAIAFVIAFLGWMPAPLDISVWHSLWALEKRKDQQSYSLKESVKDFNLGYASTIILGFLFLSLGALIMYNSGQHFAAGAAPFASQFLELYTETLGPYAYYLVAVAAFAAMFSTTLTTLDASPRSMAKAGGLLFGKGPSSSYGLWIGLLSLGTILLLTLLKTQMKTLIDLATSVSFLTAPFYAIANYTLVCSRHMPEDHRPGILMHILSISGIIFLIGFSIWYLLNPGA